MSAQEPIPLVVMDLDGTLIRRDSMKQLLLIQLRDGPQRFRLIFWILLRAFGLAGRHQLLTAIIRSLRRRTDYSRFIREFTSQIRDQLDHGLIKQVREQCGAEALFVLCSASPSDYVAPLAESLGWQSVCTTVAASGEIFHCHGYAKREAILARYPPSNYRYLLSVADSPSDQPLQELFEALRWIR